MVVLGERQIPYVAPGISLISRDPDAAVVSGNDMARIMRIDPHGVVIDMNCIDTLPGRKRPAAVDGQVDEGIQVVYPVRIYGIHKNFAKIERATGNIVVLIHYGPALSAVIGSQDGTLGGFDKGINDVGVAAESGERNSPQIASGKTIFHGFSFPGLTAVVADVHA